MSQDEARRKAFALRDGLGRPLDLEMEEVIAALIFLQIDTFASCIGHESHGAAYPWIDFAKPSQENESFLLSLLPSFHFVNKGAGGNRRLLPRQLSDIRGEEELSWQHYAKERQQLATFAATIFAD